jgi:predicted DNA-binding transcriptional regulator YafY
MRQMDRRLLVLMRLREEVPVRAADLAEEMACSVRTVYRDIDALCQAGVPVAAMPGEGYRLVPGYHLPPVAFTTEEAVQLLLGADLAAGLGTQDQRDAALSAVAKVEAVLQPQTRAEVEVLRDRIRVSSWPGRSPSPHLALLQQGVIESRVLHLRYRAYESGEITERKVEPHGLTHYGGDWHLVAYCRLREGMRDFRAGRILEARALDETFERIPDSQWYADDTSGEYREVRVWVEADTVPWARETAGFGFDREEPVEGGSVFVFLVRDVRRFLPWVLGWGSAARVISPPDVVGRVSSEAVELARVYLDDRLSAD